MRGDFNQGRQNNQYPSFGSSENQNNQWQQGYEEQ